MLFTICLKDIDIHAPVGVYPEEKINGNDFLIKISLLVDINERFLHNDDINGVLDYSKIALCAKQIMTEGADLLETAAWRIAREIIGIGKDNGFELKEVEVCVEKLSPPIPSINLRSASATVVLKA